MTTTESRLLDVRAEISIAVPPERLWPTVVDDLDAWCRSPMEGASLGLRLEPRVGGLFYRDRSGEFGEGAGHLWGLVQVFLPGRKLEIRGPFWLSEPVVTHLAIVLTPETVEDSAGTRVTLTHRSADALPADTLDWAQKGWSMDLEWMKRHAEQQH